MYYQFCLLSARLYHRPQARTDPFIRADVGKGRRGQGPCKWSCEWRILYRLCMRRSGLPSSLPIPAISWARSTAQLRRGRSLSHSYTLCLSIPWYCDRLAHEIPGPSRSSPKVSGTRHQNKSDFSGWRLTYRASERFEATSQELSYKNSRTTSQTTSTNLGHTLLWARTQTSGETWNG